MNNDFNPEVEHDMQADLERYQQWLHELLTRLMEAHSTTSTQESH